MTPTAELLTRLFSLLERAYMQIGCDCHGTCEDCARVQYDLEGLLYNETQGDRP